MRALLIATGILGLVIATSAPAAAQSGTGMAIRTAEDFGIEVDPQITNASNALEEALKTWATSGESTRGATGAIGALIIESDNLMCNAWMTSFYTAMTQMSTSAAFSDAGTAVLQAMNRLRSLIEAACEKALKGSRTIGVIGGGEGGVVDGPAGLVPNTCPDCPYEKNAVEIADYRLASAQYRAARAAARTDWAYELAGTRPEVYGQFFVSKPQELEREQEAAEAAVEKAQAALDRAKRAYDACIAACRKHAGFFDRNRKAVLATAAALVATTVFVAGGGGTPTTLVSTPPVQQPVATTPAAPPPTTTPVVSAPPAPAPATLLSLILGRWICAACRAINDPDRHENTLRFCVQLIAAFQLLANSPLRIEHPAPWVTVTGELDETSGSYRATGVGSVSGFSNVSSTVTASFQRSGDTVTAVDLTVTLGENGVFPGGRPVTYSVRLTKTP